jgi:uncharacterized spore protein YtfJ
MKLEELLAKAKDTLDSGMVYTEPVEKDGITVIAAARIVGGGGGGGGTDQKGQQGEGGGLGLIAKPAGAFVIRDGKVRWEPAIDVNRIMLTVCTVIVTALLVAGRIVRIRTLAAVSRRR